MTKSKVRRIINNDKKKIIAIQTVGLFCTANLRHKGFCRQIHYGSLRFTPPKKCYFTEKSLSLSVMNTHSQHIESLRRAVLSPFARTLDAATDYDALSLDISAVTGEAVSSSTLKRLFGYDKHTTEPRPSTLSTLARYVGYSGWSDFCERYVAPDVPMRPQNGNMLIWLGLLLIVGGLIALVTILISGDDAPTTPLQHQQPADQELIEEIKGQWLTLSQHRCDSIRTYRAGREIKEYDAIVNAFYYPYVFTELKSGVRRDIDALSLAATTYAKIAENEIFSSCQELCAELMREIADELRESQYGQTE